MVAATFGWLCVETITKEIPKRAKVAATFGWLCVETAFQTKTCICLLQPPSGGCVLKRALISDDTLDQQAATFGWLCVETIVATY